MIRRLKALLADRRERDGGNDPQVLIELGVAWGGMSAKERRAFLGFLAEAELPKGCTVEVGQ